VDRVPAQGARRSVPAGAVATQSATAQLHATSATAPGELLRCLIQPRCYEVPPTPDSADSSPPSSSKSHTRFRAPAGILAGWSTSKVAERETIHASGNRRLGQQLCRAARGGGAEVSRSGRRRVRAGDVGASCRCRTGDPARSGTMAPPPLPVRGHRGGGGELPGVAVVPRSGHLRNCGTLSEARFGWAPPGAPPGPAG
jgi:hypothetical protein